MLQLIPFSIDIFTLKPLRTMNLYVQEEAASNCVAPAEAGVHWAQLQHSRHAGTDGEGCNAICRRLKELQGFRRGRSVKDGQGQQQEISVRWVIR